MRPFPVAPAYMQPHPVPGNALKRPVQSVDMLFDLICEFGFGQILIEQHPFHRQVGGVNLQHEAGIHQHGVIQHRATYEIMKPEDIGLGANALVLGKHSGRHALRKRLEELGYELSDDQLREMFVEFKGDAKTGAGNPVTTAQPAAVDSRGRY